MYPYAVSRTKDNEVEKGWVEKSPQTKARKKENAKGSKELR